ncbi:hypothetical protein I4U23_021758 [Adineta vaga]|nr:hypothetical protein I4U23_021758 [Adineta vaga]
MSMKDLNKEFEKLFQNRINENKLQKKLDQLIDEYGINQINLWRNLSNRTKNTLLHELVEQNYPDTVKHMIQKYQLRTFFKRDSDQLTPIELAFSNQNWKIFDLLLEFGDEKTREQVSKDISLKKQKEQMMNIVWMDLEFTSFDNPQILECAVIITNKDLQEIKRKIMKRWTPKTASQFSKEISSNGRDIVNHRAMDDIEWSIEMMKLFRPLLTSKQFSKGSSRIKDESISENLPLIPSSFDRTKLNSEEKHLIKRIEFEQTFHIDELHLNTEEQRIYNENPHLREVFLNHEQIIFHQEDFTLENRLLNQSIISKTKLRQIQTTENWTQRKLLLIEIEFLTKFYNEHDKILIIYAGAAPGSHINYLNHIETEGLDHCYDCTAEIFILKNYFFTIQHINDEKQLYQSIAQLSYEISKNISDKYRLPFLKGKRSLNIIPKN